MAIPVALVLVSLIVVWLCTWGISVLARRRYADSRAQFETRFWMLVLGAIGTMVAALPGCTAFMLLGR